MADERNRETEQLLQNLHDCSTGMVNFSVVMKSLFTENSISVTDQTRGLVEVRDSTRKNAAIYTEKILPLSEKIVQNISTFTDYYQFLELDDWKDTLDDQIEQLNQATADCNLMIQMHKSIITSLNRDKGKVIIEIEKIKLSAEKFKEQADANQIGGIVTTTCATVFAGVAAVAATGGAATVMAVGAGATAIYNASQQIAHTKNVEICDRNVDLAQPCIHALESFISGLRGVSAFFTTTKSNLEKMKSHGDKAAKDKKSVFFKMMKGVSYKIDYKCKEFLNMAQFLRSELGSIPLETSDKNYVDEWLEEELKKYQMIEKEDEFHHYL